MSDETQHAFNDLVSTIQNRLTSLKQSPIARDNFPMSFGNKRGRGKKQKGKGRGSSRGRGRGRGKGKQRGKRDHHSDFDHGMVSRDTTQFKRAVDDFTTAEDKKKWYFERFIKYYNKLPQHLRSKYDAPSITETITIPTASDDADNVDITALIAEIESNGGIETPDFFDKSTRSRQYIHNKITSIAPMHKKRKLNPVPVCNGMESPESPESPESISPNTLDPMTTEMESVGTSGGSLAVESMLNEKERQSVWTHLDGMTSYYYSRYLFYCSMVIGSHWQYVEREEALGRINNRDHIFMAEFKDPKELEQHLSIRSPDPRIPDKYWYQRYRYFSKFDDGIKLDIESWYSVTPELIALNIAKKCKCNVVMDAMCGSGGNTIAFAQHCDFVIAIDIDPQKVEMAKHNAKIYGVDHRIQFIVADFFEIAPSFAARKGSVDVVFLSPPWGGQFYQQKLFDIRNLADDESMNGVELFELAKQITPNIAYFLPKNTNYRQLQSLAKSGEKCEIARNHLYKKVKAITAYYGNLCRKNKKKGKK